MKCGYVAILGRPNAGKSSLMNFLVGEEVAIVSHRQQTTRNSILGIRNGEGYQMLFVDTPGIHHSKNNLDRFMNKAVRSATAGADVILYLFDGSKEIDEEEQQYIENLQQNHENVVLVCTKSDKKQVRNSFDAINVSVVSGQGTDILVQKIVALLPEGNALFDEDMFTDKNVSFLISEKIRGLLLENLDKEVPHGVAVEIEKFVEDETMAKIDATIICEREQHKGIIIGKGGANLKKLGQLARIYAEELLDKKCVLKLFVKVDENWRDKNISAHGYN